MEKNVETNGTDRSAHAGKVALVTGSSSGIGACIARKLADLGCRVIVNSSRSVEAGEALASSLPDATYVQASITEDDGVARLLAAAEAWGSLDILVNNAGTTRVIPHNDLEAASVEVWREIFEVNVFGTWRMSQKAIPLMAKGGGGSIVNVSSVAGVRCTGSSMPYASSKAALNHQTKLLARVVGPEVRVNAVAPGLIDTPWTSDWDEQRSTVTRNAPLGRVGTPEDVAEVAVALATSGYVTGEVVCIDGGLGLGQGSIARSAS